MSVGAAKRATARPSGLQSPPTLKCVTLKNNTNFKDERIHSLLAETHVRQRNVQVEGAYPLIRYAKQSVARLELNLR